MFKVNTINNVNYTLNKQPSFGAGVRTNHGVKPQTTDKNVIENGIFTVFGGVFNDLVGKILHTRAESIETGLNQTKLNLVG